MQPSNVAACMDILREGVQKHQLPLAEIPDLIDSLGRHEDFISDELGFEFIAGRLRVSLHDREAWCEPGSFLTTLQHMHSHRQLG